MSLLSGVIRRIWFGRITSLRRDIYTTKASHVRVGEHGPCPIGLHRSEKLGQQHCVQVSPDEPGAVKENHRAAERPSQEIPESDEHLSIERTVPCERNRSEERRVGKE